jgi:hypothetical protein
MVTSPGGPVNPGRPTSRTRRPLRPRKQPDLGPFPLREEDAADETGRDSPTKAGAGQTDGKDGTAATGGDACRGPHHLPSGGVFLPWAVLLVAHTAAEDRVLGDLWYWTVATAKGEDKPRAKLRYGDRSWVWRVLPRFAERLGLKTGQVRRAIITLTDKGFVVKARGGGGRTLLSADRQAIMTAARETLASDRAKQLAQRAENLTDRLAWRRGITVPAWALGLTTTSAEERFLGQLNYWMGTSKETGRSRARFDFGDRLHWEQKSYASWAAEMFTMPAAVERAVRSLRRNGFVVVKHVGGGQAAKFRIDWDAVHAAYWT